MRSALGLGRLCFAPPKLGLYGVSDEDRHSVRADQGLNPLPLLVGQSDLRLFDVHRRSAHASRGIRPLIVCQSHKKASPLIDTLSVPGYITGDAYGDKPVTYYSREIKMPATRKDGLCNFVQMIINQIEAGKAQEALLTAADLLDTLSGNANPFAEVTEGRDNAMVEELNRKHAAEMREAIVRAHQQGVEEGQRQQKAKLVEMLGLAA